MSDQPPARRRFMTWMLLILAVAAVIFVGARVLNVAGDHAAAPAASSAER